MASLTLPYTFVLARPEVENGNKVMEKDPWEEWRRLGAGSYQCKETSNWERWKDPTMAVGSLCHLGPSRAVLYL